MGGIFARRVLSAVDPIAGRVSVGPVDQAWSAQEPLDELVFVAPPAAGATGGLPDRSARSRPSANVPGRADAPDGAWAASGASVGSSVRSLST